MQTVKKETKIILCPICKGNGLCIETSRTNMYGTDAKRVVCQHCQGKGRVLERIVVSHYFLEED